MYLIDTNIFVYSNLTEYHYLRDLFVRNDVFMSEISRVEVLGYHKITSVEESYFLKVFKLVPILILTQEVFDLAITIRKSFNLKLGDSLIAATAQFHNLEIQTRNLKDFKRVTGLICTNPML